MYVYHDPNWMCYLYYNVFYLLRFCIELFFIFNLESNGSVIFLFYVFTELSELCGTIEWVLLTGWIFVKLGNLFCSFKTWYNSSVEPCIWFFFMEIVLTTILLLNYSGLLVRSDNIYFSSNLFILFNFCKESFDSFWLMCFSLSTLCSYVHT